MNFEEATKKLDEIIFKLENGNLNLAQSVELFEEAEKLIQICQTQFTEAKGKLMVIHNNLEKVLNFDGECL